MSANANASFHSDLGLAAKGGSQRRVFLWLNLIGGTLVLASYVWGPSARPDLMGAIWGGVPEAIRPLYQINMFLAAAGYLVFTAYLFFAVRESELRFGRGRTTLNLCYFMVLIPSALWLPLTVRMIEAPSPLLWFAIRSDLMLVGLGALGILLSLLRVDSPGSRFRIAAIVGALPFVLQTAVLDALVWPAFYPNPTF